VKKQVEVRNVTINSNNLFVNFCWTFTNWEIVWWNAPRVWQDFGSALPRLTQTKPVLPLSNENSSQVKDQGRQQCCHNKHKKFPYQSTHDVFLLSRHVSSVSKRVSYQKLYGFFVFSTLAVCSVHHIFLNFTVITLGDLYKLRTSLSCNILYSHVLNLF